MMSGVEWSGAHPEVAPAPDPPYSMNSRGEREIMRVENNVAVLNEAE